MRTKKGWYKTDNIYHTTKGTTYVRYSTNKHPSGAGHKSIIHKKK